MTDKQINYYQEIEFIVASGDVDIVTDYIIENICSGLVLEDEEHESADLVVVLLSSDDKVLAQHKTKVGIDS